MKFLLLRPLLLLAVCFPAKADTWKNADLYLVNWDVTTRASLTIESVKKLANYHRKIDSDVSKVVTLLDLAKLTKSDSSKEDARFVAELYTDQGKKITFYASQFNLCNADNSLKRKINEEFKKSVSKLMK